MMKKFLLLLIVMVCLLIPSQSALAYSDYYIKNYDVNIKVNEDATYEVTEIIDVFFNESRHGIFRTIPTNYSNQRAIIRDVFISDEYSTSKTLKDTTFKIGDADTYVTGDQQYEISYIYDVGDDNIPDFDQFYYNIVGTSWDTTIDHVTFSVQFPGDFDKDNIWLSKGAYGSEQFAQADFTKLGYKITGYSEKLYPYEGLTLKVEFVEGYFVGERNNTEKSTLFSIIGWVACLMLIVVLYLLWAKHGKDDKLYPTVQFSAPGDMTSAEVGYVIDGIVDNKDITSLIIYWADKGYLTIEELDKNKFEFIKVMSPVDGKKYEQQMFKSFFALGDGIKVTTTDLEQKFYTELPALKQMVKWEYKGEKEIASKKAKTISNLSMLFLLIPVVSLMLVVFSGVVGAELIMGIVFSFIAVLALGYIFKQFIRKWHLFSKFAKVSRIIFVCLIVAIMTVIILLGLFVVKDTYYQSIWSLGFIVGETLRTVLTIVAVYILAGVMEKRTSYGHELLEKLLGLKEFIETAEMDKLKLLSEENPEYFYNILPYAMVLGLDKTWAKKFDSITLEPPKWYGSSYGRGFSSMIFYSQFNSVMTRTNQSMQMPKSSGSSMGGGGFSGGGSGGGGGGSW